ncbi:MAG: hypothetical protein U0T82_17255 [Bacteroidales bacterium]
MYKVPGRYDRYSRNGSGRVLVDLQAGCGGGSDQQEGCTRRPGDLFTSTCEKYNAVIDEVQHLLEIGRPVLVGTTSVEVFELEPYVKDQGDQA